MKEIVKVGEICEILDSQRVPITARNRVVGPYPYYGANGVQDYVNDYIFDDELVLLAEDGGNFGSKEKPIAYRVSGKCWVNNHAHVLKPKPGLNVDYLCYSLMFYDVSSLVNGATRQKLTQSDMRKMEIPMRSIKEQHNIVLQLGKINHMVLVREKELLLLDELIKARFVEMFGNEMNDGIPLKDCCIDVRGGGTPSMQHPEYYGGDVPFIKSGDVRGDTVSSGALWLTEQALSETTAKYVPKGSVLVVNRSASLLREFRAAIAIQPVVINQDIKAFIPRKEFTSEYLLWAIKIQTQLLLTKVTTVLTSHIDLKDLLDLRIVPASIERQKDFSIFINQVDKSKVAVQKALDEAQVLFDSLMQQYFG